MLAKNKYGGKNLLSTSGGTQGVLRRLGRPLILLHDLVTDVGYVIGALAIGAMALIYAYEVVARYFFNAPTHWGLEAVTYLLLVAIFLVLPGATRARSHITVDIIADYIGRRTRWMTIALNVVGFSVCGIVAWFGWSENVRQYVNFIETMGNVPLPKWWISSFITLGFALTALWFLRLCFSDEPAQPLLPFLRSRGAAG